MKTILSKPRILISLVIVVGMALLMTAAAELLVYAAFESNYSNAHLLEYAVAAVSASGQPPPAPVPQAQAAVSACASAAEPESLIGYLASQGEPTSFGTRAFLARAYGIEHYQGTPAQNKALLRILVERTGCVQ